MRPIDRFDRARHDLQLDCLSNHHDEPQIAPADNGAPVSALTPEQSFWDHLGATRADEYVQEDILPGVTFPAPPARDCAAAAFGDEGAEAAPIRHAETSPMALLHADDEIARDQLADGAVWLGAVDPGKWDESAGATGLGLRDDLALPFPEPVVPAAKYQHRRKRRSPSRLTYRLQRIWLTPLYRRAIKTGIPLAAVLAFIGATLGHEDRRMAIVAQAEAAYSSVIDRPEFMVTDLELPPAAPVLAEAIQALLQHELPVSSWRIDLDELRARIEALDAVRVADLRLGAGGVLSVSVTERVPAVLWRSPHGLEVLDAEGIRIGFAPDRSVRPDLPVIAGLGADAHVAEALALVDAAAPFGARLRGLVRQGERRWDVVLDRDQRIKLPEYGAVTALERVIAYDQAQDLLARDLLVADLRNPARPTLQIGPGAVETIRAIRAQN